MTQEELDQCIEHTRKHYPKMLDDAERPTFAGTETMVWVTNTSTLFKTRDAVHVSGALAYAPDNDQIVGERGVLWPVFRPLAALQALVAQGEQA